jgi:hypothetical protein
MYIYIYYTSQDKLLGWRGKYKTTDLTSSNFASYSISQKQQAIGKAKDEEQENQENLPPNPTSLDPLHNALNPTPRMEGEI